MLAYISYLPTLKRQESDQEEYDYELSNYTKDKCV
jgi:hypothetical protein